MASIKDPLTPQELEAFLSQFVAQVKDCYQQAIENGTGAALAEIGDYEIARACIREVSRGHDAPKSLSRSVKAAERKLIVFYRDVKAE
jgi:hypothetical protein